MSHIEFAGRVETLVQYWRDGFLPSSAMERVAALSDELKEARRQELQLTLQLTASIRKQQDAELREQERCREIAREQWCEDNEWRNTESDFNLGLPR